jgi:hypothetical protein
MKTFITTFAFALVASIAFFACDMGGYTSECQLHKKPLAKVAVVSETNPFVSQEVQDWIEDQINSGKNDMRQVIVQWSEEPPPVSELDVSRVIDTEYGGHNWIVEMTASEIEKLTQSYTEAFIDFVDMRGC